MEHPIVISSSGEIAARPKNSFQGILSQVLNSQQGRSQLAAAMAAPIRRNLDYTGIARKIFSVEPMPQGALAIYDKDDE
jgi:hypothetical protein